MSATKRSVYLSIAAALVLGSSMLACSSGPNVGERKGGGGGGGNGGGNSNNGGSTAGPDAGDESPMDAGTSDAAGGTPSSDTKGGTSQGDTNGGGTTMDAGGDDHPPCWDSGTGESPSCSEPSSCPSTQQSKDPEITCYRPHWFKELQKNTLHIYGKHFVKPNGDPPRRVVYRSTDATGTVGKTVEDIQVISNCHVKLSIDFSSSLGGLQCGETMEFRLQRTQGADPTSKGKISDWHEIRITK